MKTDTLLNIYQSYTLTKVSELNKQSLIALYAQNKQLSQLNEELARANRTTEQILRNQIKEIELQEKRRYYKNMTFNLSQALDLLENEENVNFRIFASGLFLSPIRDMAKDAVQELEEIADKEYAQNIVKRVKVLFENDNKYIDSYQNTPWSTFLSFKSNASQTVLQNKRNIRKYTPIRDEKETKLQKLLEEKSIIKERYDKALEEENNSKNTSTNELHVKNQGTKQDSVNPQKRIKGCCLGCAVILTVFLVIVALSALFSHEIEAVYGFIIILIVSYAVIGIAYYLIKDKNLNNFQFSIPQDAKSNKVENLKLKLQTLQQEIDPLQNELEAQDNYIQKLQQEITSLQDHYNCLLQGITADCPKWESKLNDIAEFIPHKEKKKLEDLDPLFTEAAKLIIKKKDISTSLIQRKFAIGYNRAARIMNQLEECGIVGTEEGSKSKRLLCESEEELSELIKALTL